MDKNLLDALQTVCQLAEDHMKAEQKLGFEGWDSEDVVASQKALLLVKDQFVIETV